MTDPTESAPPRPTLRAVIYSDAGRVEFPISHVGVTINGEVQLMGDDEDGRPFSIVVSGRDREERSLIGVLSSVREEMMQAFGKADLSEENDR